ncbi:MAG TPA: hypothetical protein VET48_03015, partial [Steroidobacteraceae bacterium]|nr:hypothetical protein [Steroidobacteraceae bacterium]
MSEPLFTSILVTGADASSFLQGQLSCDMDALTRDRPLLAAINSAQGRVQAVVNVLERDEGIVLLVVSEMAERTIQRLRKYVLRSKVKIEKVDSSLAAAYSLPPTASLLEQLRAGIPHIFPQIYEAFVAQMLNLDSLGAISFNKGCYTGQEIISRAHYRGAVKRRMYRFAANCSPPAPGTRVLSNNEHAGDVVYAAATEQGCELLAVVSLTHIDSTLTIDAHALSKLSLPY